MSADSALAQEILENQLTAIFLLDEELSVEYLNSAAEQLLGRSAQHFYGQPFLSLFQHIGLDANSLIEALTLGISFTDSEVHMLIGASSHLSEVTATAVILTSGQYLLLEVVPIERQKKISQEQLQHAQQQAANHLIRGLAHEIKNPLGGIRGAAQLLHRQLDDNEQEFTQIIIEQTDRLRLLVDRLLGPQKPSQKKQNNLHLVLEKVLRLLSIELPDSITIQRNYDPSLPDFEMSSDLVEQAILNIVSNAVQILSQYKVNPGRIELQTRAAHRQTIHGIRYRLVAELTIRDNGPGIPNHIRDTLFYPMVTAREGGSGLGLSIAQNLINQHQGRIECMSVPGQTEFIIHLPIRK